jgi:hypothetical protein
MAKTIDNMLFVEANGPEELKTRLNSFEVPFSIMQGSLGSRPGKHYCWVLFDRPATVKVRKGRAKPRKVEVSEDVKTLKED